MKNEKKELNIIDAKTKEENRKIIDKKLDFDCALNSCKNKAIWSHTLQKKGILKNLSEDNEVFATTFHEISPAKSDADNFLYKTNIKNATGFLGFCYEHDNSIFKSIEKDNQVITDSEYVFLNAYRGFSHIYFYEKYVRDKNYAKNLKRNIISNEGISSYRKSIFNIYNPDEFLNDDMHVYQDFDYKCNDVLETKRQINELFKIYYYPLDQEPEFAAMSATTYLSEKVVCMGVLPGIYQNKPMFYMMYLKDDEIVRQYREQIELYSEESNKSNFYNYIQNLLVITAGIMVLKPSKRQKMINDEEYDNMIKLHQKSLKNEPICLIEDYNFNLFG